jgi:addiction module toxin, RelE/StbE family
VNYTIELSRAADKAFKKVPQADAKKTRDKIEKLKKEPFPRLSEKLEGSDGLYRIRSGDYRIIYQILEKKLLILVVKIGHRREVYRSGLFL